jgi:hypothetical protein
MTCIGRTDPDDTDWVQYNENGVYLDVDTSLCGLETPLYFTSLGGDSQHWYTTGATSIYDPTPNGFRVYVNRPGITVADARSNRWHVNWVAHPDDARGPELCTGSTSTSGWKDLSENSIYFDVDTSACDFASTPFYLTSLGGDSRHWTSQGATSIYEPTRTGFRVQVKADGLTAAIAKDFKWHINWKGAPTNRQDLGACGGKTSSSAWQEYATNGVYVDVAISSTCRALLTQRDVLKQGTTSQMTPHVFTSLGGRSNHFGTRGATSIYSLTANGFRVYVNREGITPAKAADYGWFVNWLLQP